MYCLLYFFAMNKNVDQVGTYLADGRKTYLSPSELKKVIRPIHIQSQLIKMQKPFPHEYLQSELISSQSQSPAKHLKKMTLLPVEPMAVRKLKQQLRCKRKKLIIDCQQDKQLYKESTSMVMAKSQILGGQNKIKGFSSEKKSTIVQAFQVNTLPKKSFSCEKYICPEEEKKCELINSILQRYKIYGKSDRPDKKGSPTISILKLNSRSHTEPKPIISPQKSKDNEALKPTGWKPSPSNKTSNKAFRLLISKRQKSETYDVDISPKKKTIILEEIAPWQTDQLLI